MKKNRLLFSIGLIGITVSSLTFSSCSDDDSPTTTGLIATDAQIVNQGSGYGFTEGPAVDGDGNVFFTDQNNNMIYKWDATSGDIDPFLDDTGRSNGMAFDKDGFLIACADMHGELWKINTTTKTHEVLVDNYDGKLLNGPNDVWINPVTGGMYITDPLFPRNFWDADDERRTKNFVLDEETGLYTGDQIWPPTHSEQAETGKGGHVYYLAPGASSLVRVTTMGGWEANSWPNGVVGTPDGKKLYVNKWEGDDMGGTWVFDINSDGTLSNMTKFIDMGGDGMSMDNRGNIYISNGFGVVAFDPTGEELVRIFTGGGATNNVFAGSDEKTLFITGPSTKVNTLKMNVKGVEKF